MPTFKFPGMDIDVLDLIKEVLQRLACRFIKNIIDILKTPLCSDNLVEDLYGAGSNLSSPSIKKALGDGLVDLGIPSSSYGQAGNMLDDITKLLTPRELCALLQGESLPQAAIQTIIRLARSHGMQDSLYDEQSITTFFDSLGAFLDPSFCDDLNTISENLARYGCNTLTAPFNQIRNKILRNDSVSDEEIQHAFQTTGTT